MTTKDRMPIADTRFPFAFADVVYVEGIGICSYQSSGRLPPGEYQVMDAQKKYHLIQASQVFEATREEAEEYWKMIKRKPDFVAEFVCRNCEAEFHGEYRYGIELWPVKGFIKIIEPDSSHGWDFKPDKYVRCEACGSKQISRKYTGALAKHDAP